MNIDISLDENRKYGVFIDELFGEPLTFNHSVAIITNETVAPLYLDELINHIKAPKIVKIIIKDGEKYKNMASIEYILNELFRAKLDRKSTLIALGGGVISDMVGFAASIYERGIKFINIPTTLLAQIDASVGGKTGINNDFGKNLIGSFWQPAAVFCESEFLASLPLREFSVGIAEAVKMAVMFDEKFFAFLEENSKDFASFVATTINGDGVGVVGDLARQKWVQNTIKRCVELKAEVVNKDEREAGIRAVLNYGHTFAHAIESAAGYGNILHGEAVAIGMVMANDLSVSLGLLKQGEADRVKKMLRDFNLPVSYKIGDKLAFYESFKLDKKSENGDIKFILADKIGSWQIKGEVATELVIRSFG